MNRAPEFSFAIRAACCFALTAVLFAGNAPYAFAEFSAKFFVTQDNVSRPAIRADETSGALVYSVPLVIPPGRNGLQPDLSLVYNSQRRNNDNILGYGWDISIPSIERMSKSGTETLYSDNYYQSSFDGELFQSASSTDTREYGPRVSSDDSKEYTFFETDSAWQTVDKFGTIYTFGSTTAARQDNPSDSTKIYKWMLQEVRDKNGNYITYTYTKDNGQIYPSTITYTGHGTTDGDFEISFGTESRSDYLSSRRTAFSVESWYRINQILVKIDDAWVRKYDLAYTTGANGGRSLLSSITETGKDKDGNTVALPATTFTYQSGNPSWSIDTAWDSPVNFIESEYGGDNSVRFAEVNGDGLIDIWQARASPGQGGCDTKNTWLNTGNGWQSGGTNSPECFRQNETVFSDDTGARIGDFDGDGRTDVVRAIYDYGLAETVESFYVNMGSGFEEHPEWDIPTYFYHTYSGYVNSFLVDVNTDGAEDVIGGGAVYLFEATTTGWSMSSGEYGHAGDQPEDPAGQQFADVNGDGLIDRLVSAYHPEAPAENKNKVYLNSGVSFEFNASTIPLYFYDFIGVDKGVRVADVNNDGLPDIIQGMKDGGGESVKVYKNVSTSTPNWIYDSSLSSAIPAVYFAYSNDRVDGGWRATDVNGDGLVDFIGTYYYDPPTSEVEVETYINQGNHADILSQVTTAQGGTIDVTYQSSLAYRNADGTLANKESPSPVMTVHTITKNDGFGAPATETRDYAGASYYHSGAEDRFFAGFQIASTTDGAGNRTLTYFHTGSSTDSALGEYDDHISKAGKPFRIEKYDNAGNLYEKTLNKWERYDEGDGRNFVKLTQTLAFAYDGDADHKDKAESYGWNDESRNLSDKAEWGEVAGSDDGTFADVGSDKRVTVFSYATSTDVTGRVAQESTRDYAGITVKDTIRYYDTLSFGSVGAGNETKREEWVSDTTYIDFEKTYNSYGLVTQELDPRDKATTYVYDWRNLYAATSTNPEGHVTERYFDYSSGKPEKTVDPNGREFETVYDGLDRATTEKIPDVDAPTTLVTKKTVAYTDTVGSRKTLETNYLNAATSSLLYAYLDGFDRKIQERKEAEESDTYGVRDFEYNLLGLLSRESLPYFGTGSSLASSTTNTNLYTTYTYDALKRLTKEENAVGSTTRAYDDWGATTTDALSRVKGFVSDAFGRLAAVNETDDTATYTTSYAYNARNDLVKITDSLANVRNFTYDALSRLILSEDLHDSADTGFASTTYAYDSAGNITSKQDGKLQTVTYAYDDINRVLTEDNAGEAGTEMEYGYDACAEGVGRLCAATTTDAVVNFAYNALGNVASEAKTITYNLEPITYITSFTYDRQGNTTDIIYPDSGTVAYRFNSAGLLETVETLPISTSTLSSFTISNINYAPTEQPTARVFGNSDVSLYTYDEDALYRLSNITTLVGTTTSFDGTNPVATIGATNVQQDGADLIGTLADMMGAETVTVGFRYGLLLDDDDPWTATTTTITATSTGPFSISLLGLDDFKDYSYEAFMSTSSTAVYYGGRHRFYTADLTRSYPVYKEQGRAWVLTTYDNFGTHASTTVDGNKLKLANWGSTSTPQYEAGYWLSDPWDLSSITNVEGSFIEYCACARNGADVIVKTAITTSTSTEPVDSDFIIATSTTAIPGITTGENLYGKYLWLKIELTPNWTATGTPCLCRINLAINDVATTTSAHNALQSLTYTYDAVGNITSIVDLSGFGGDKHIYYTYDDLYRLTNASTTVPANGGYNQTFTYDRVGNILTSPQGSYTYAETGFTNPHASTQIGNSALTYDNNGNVTDYGNDDYEWNYRDRLISSNVGGANTFYGYDFNNDRVTKGNGTATTTYANKYYNQLGATTTKHIYDNLGTLLATIEGNGEATSTNFIHTDHLGGTDIVVDEDGDVVEETDYYPYGEQRVNTTNTGFKEQKKFTGHEFDTESDLTYAKARYYDQDTAKFFGIDPAFLAIGTLKLADILKIQKNEDETKEEEKKRQKEALQKYLSDPQNLNSYSYARNNPVLLYDSTGEFGLFAGPSAGGDLAIGVGASGGFSLLGGFTMQNLFSKPDFGFLMGGGGFVGGPGSPTLSFPKMSDKTKEPISFGAYAGAGLSFMVTNATDLGELGGTSQQGTVNLPLIGISFSQSKNGVWTFTVNIGPGAGASINIEETETKVED